MGIPLFTNQAATTLMIGMDNSSQTTIVVQPTDVSLFPVLTPGSGNYFVITLVNQNNSALYEIVRVTATNGNVWTIVRGQEGTTQQVFNQGDYAQLRLTAAQIQYFQTAQFTSQEEYQIATQGQTVFNLGSFYYQPGTDNLAVFVDGVKQIVGVSYAETSNNSITFTNGLHDGAYVEFITNAALGAGNFPATEVSIQDAGNYYTSDNVEGALQEIGEFEEVTLPGPTGASLIGYKYPDTNSVTETVQDRLAQYVSVKDFGAKGDGITDDTNAILNAVAYIQTAKGTLYFPKGTYIVEQAIQLNSSITVKGAGLNATTIKRTTANAETIDGHSVKAVFYVTGGWNHILDLTITGVEGTTTVDVTGIQFGYNIAAKGSVKNVAINFMFNAVNEVAGLFLTEFNNVQAVSSENGFNFNSATQKTSLNLTDCYCANTGPAYVFNLVDYSVIDSCAADNCNWGSQPANPYGVGYGNPASSTGVYSFNQSVVTLNNIGAEGSYGNGVVSTGSTYLNINGMYSYGCMSLYQPNYTAYPNYAVGPILVDTSGSSVFVSNAINYVWTNSYVATNYPSKPVASLVAFNYDENVFGQINTTAVFVTGQVNETTCFAGDSSVYPKYCKTPYSMTHNGYLYGVVNLPNISNVVRKKAVNANVVTGTGTTITIPVTSQPGQNYKHMITIKGIDGTTNSATAAPFGSTISFGSLTSLIGITSNNAFGISSVTSSGTNLQIVLSTSHTNPIVDLEIVSENIALINYASISIA